MKTRAHAIAGAMALFIILCFWTSTVISELLLTNQAVALVKLGVMYGMIVLVPAMMLAGATGMTLGKTRSGEIVTRKKKRMPVIALNGVIILIPSAIFLYWKSSAGEFDSAFYIAQGGELIAGLANIALIAMSMRDGLTLSGRIRAGSHNM